MSISKKFNVEFFFGTSSMWGFEISYAPYENALTIMFIRWYFGFAIWRDNGTEA